MKQGNIFKNFALHTDSYALLIVECKMSDM